MPSQIAPFSEKRTPEFGLSVANSIVSDWFLKVGGSQSRFYTSREEFLERRMYAQGKVDMTKYLPKLGTNGDTSLLNLSKKSLSTIPKIVDLIVNGMCNRNYSITAKAIDPTSNEQKQAYRRAIEQDQNSLPIIQAAKEQFGLDIANMPLDKLPETKEELDIHMQMDYKPSICLSEELAIKTIFDENAYDLTTYRQIARDLVVDGFACVKNRFSPAKGVIIERVDGMNKIQSYSRDPYFRDCFYHGEVKETLISDVLVEYPFMNSAEYDSQKKQLLASGQQWYMYNNIDESDRIKGTTNLLYFTYKTTRETANKVKNKADGGVSISSADEVFDESKKNKKDKYKRFSKVEEVLFEGVLVLGTDILLKWEVAKSMSRPKSNKQKVQEQYIMIAPNYENGDIASLVSRMIPIEDALNVIELKAEQIIQGITPDGIAIDLDAIAELDLGAGGGKKSGPQEQFAMYLQKGSFFYRSYGAGGDYNNAQKPFTEIKTGDSINKLTALRNESMTYLRQLTDVIGLNKASDASTPDKDSLVGIQKMAANNSNLATRHVLDGASYLTLNTAISVSYRVSDIVQYYPSLRDDLIRKIGANAVEDLNSIADLHLSDFAIFMQLEMDDEERALLNQDMSVAMEKGYISLADKYKVQDVKVLNLAIQYLTILITKNEKKRQEEEANKFKVQSDENIRAAQGAEKAKQETMQMAAQLEMAKQQAIAEAEIKKEEARGNQDRLTEQLKGENSLQLQYVINAGATHKLNTTEDRKDARTKLQATQQSELIDQRAKDKGPKNFEEDEIGMEDFKLN